MRKMFSTAVAIVVAGGALGAWTSESCATLQDFNGHLSIGYARVFISEKDRDPAGADKPPAPGGSLSLAAGVDYPIASRLRAGLAMGYHLLGSQTVKRGSLYASVDYSVFDAEAMVHWLPTGLGPVARIAAGPALISARGDLSSSGTGAGFADLAVQELAPGMAFDVTLMPHSTKLVRLGLELGTRVGFLDAATWTLAAARVTFHY